MPVLSPCLEAADRETTMAGRKEELAVLAKSKKVIQAAMAELQTSKGAPHRARVPCRPRFGAQT